VTKALASRKYQATLIAVALVVLRARLGLSIDDVRLALTVLGGYLGVEGVGDAISRSRAGGAEPPAEA
jgi:hypothetical protein